MKYIHTADLHLNSKIKRLYGEKSAIVNDKIFSSFEFLCHFALDEGAKAVVIAGDLFDSETVSPSAIQRFKSIVGFYKELCFIFVYGNHDYSPDNKMFSDFPKNFIVLKDGQSVKIENVLFLSLNRIIAPLSENSYNVVIAHGQAVNYSTTQDVSLTDLANKNVNYLALGHVHSYRVEKLDAKGVWAYPGCLVGRGFDECGDKGFILHDTDLRLTQFITVSHLFYETEFDVTNFYNVYDAEREISSLLTMPKESLVRLTLKGKVKSESTLDYGYLKRIFSDRFFYFELVDETKIDYDTIIDAGSVSLKTEFLKVVKSKNLPYEKEIIEKGLKALK